MNVPINLFERLISAQRGNTRNFIGAFVLV